LSKVSANDSFYFFPAQVSFGRFLSRRRIVICGWRICSGIVYRQIARRDAADKTSEKKDREDVPRNELLHSILHAYPRHVPKEFLLFIVCAQNKGVLGFSKSKLKQ
jgi:hypothetical protein